MRAAPFVLLGLCAMAQAGNRVVVMNERPDLPGALQMALAHQAEVSSEPATPAGEQRLDRAAAAQRTAIADNADIGVWIDDNEVWAVLADGRDVRHAPLPADATPRVFAAIATSLVDELVQPPVAPPAIVDVHVEVTPAPAVAAAAPPATTAIAVAPAAPIAAVIAPPSAVAEATPILPRPSRTLLEIGGTISNASVGGQVEMLWPISPVLRLGVLGGLSTMTDGYGFTNSGETLLDAGVELRHIGVGTGKTHFDLGPELGVAYASGGALGGIAAIRFAVTRELASTAVTAAVSPMYLFGFDGEQQSFSVLGSLSVDVPL